MTGETIHLQIPATEYSLVETSRDGLPAIVVVNSALKSFAHREVFPWFLSILIEARDLAEMGMPTAEESEALDRLGDHIEAKVLETLTTTDAINVLFVARLTWNGQRQLIYQAHDPEPVDAALQAVLAAEGAERDWEYRMEEDFSWQHAAVFLRLVS